MNVLHSKLLRAAALALAAIAVTVQPSLAQTPAKTYRGCAVVDLTKILERSKTAKAAQTRLMNEFEPQERRLTRLRSARDAAELAWLNARSSRPEAEVAELQQRLDTLTDELRLEQADFDDRLKKRKNEELDKVMNRLNVLYRKLGERERYAKLYQTDEPDPVFKPEPDARSYDCTDKTDVTSMLIRDLDAEL